MENRDLSWIERRFIELSLILGGERNAIYAVGLVTAIAIYFVMSEQGWPTLIVVSCTLVGPIATMQRAKAVFDFIRAGRPRH